MGHFAKECGITRQQLSQALRGVNGISDRCLWALVKELDVSVEEVGICFGFVREDFIRLIKEEPEFVCGGIRAMLSVKGYRPLKADVVLHKL